MTQLVSRQFLSLTLVSIGVSVFSVPVSALEAKGDKAVTSSAELGVLATSGNSSSQTVNARLSALYDLPQWRYQGAIAAASAATSDPDVQGSDLETSAERYALDLQADRKLKNDHSLFVKANYDDDRFSGFDYETGFALGYGHQVIKTPDRSFRIEVGPGYRISQPEIGDSEDEALLSTTFLFNQGLGETSEFEQTLAIDAGEERAISTSVSSLTAKINGALAMKLSLVLRHNSEPAFNNLGAEKGSMERETAVTLVYTF